MAKKPWGTITHPKERDPDFLMGYQKLSGGKIRQMVDRLYVPDWSNRNERKQLSVDRRRKVEPSDMGSEEIEKMVDRLSRDGEKKATDCNRTGSMRDQGVVNTYAWKGWNWMCWVTLATSRTGKLHVWSLCDVTNGSLFSLETVGRPSLVFATSQGWCMFASKRTVLINTCIYAVSKLHRQFENLMW